MFRRLLRATSGRGRVVLLICLVGIILSFLKIFSTNHALQLELDDLSGTFSTAAAEAATRYAAVDAARGKLQQDFEQEQSRNKANAKNIAELEGSLSTAAAEAATRHAAVDAARGKLQQDFEQEQSRNKANAKIITELEGWKRDAEEHLQLLRSKLASRHPDIQTLETTGTASSDEPADCNLTRIEIPKWASGKAASVLDAKPSTVAALVSPARFRSQSKEDQYAFKTFFQGKPKGVFLEMGALDGHQFSNTYALEKDVGWRGVLIEPEPGLFLTLILSLTLIAHRP